MTTPTKLSSPFIQKVGNGWQFNWPVEGIEAAVERVREARGGIVAEITFRCKLPTKEGLLHMARMDLFSSTARDKMAKALDKRLQGIDWQALTEQLCFLSIEEYRQGEPPINLSREPLPRAPRWIYWPYVEANGPTIFYAEGGSGKSLLALYISLGIALGAPPTQRNKESTSRNVLYLDWETGADVHTERLHALCAGLGIEREATPPIYYQHMNASLPQCAEMVADQITKLEIGFVVIDSAGLAGGGDPKEPDTALALYRAIRILDVPNLIVHHKRKSGGIKNPGSDALYGSVYWFNGARNVWDLTASKDATQEWLDVGLTHLKSNQGRLLKQRAYRIAFVNDYRDRTESIAVKEIEFADVSAFMEGMPLRQQILAELRHGAMKAADLAETLQANRASVQVKLSQMKNRNQVVPLEGDLWGLPEREQASTA